MFLSQAGGGPSELGQEYSLLDENGLPKSWKSVILPSNVPQRKPPVGGHLPHADLVMVPATYKQYIFNLPWAETS